MAQRPKIARCAASTLDNPNVYRISSAARNIRSQHFLGWARPRDVDALKEYIAELPPLPLFTIEEIFGGWVKTHEAL
jgi:ABC-type sulfate transport system substrate-binding protein